MADGLDSLTAMRSKSTTSRRTIPPPRHQPRRTPVDMPAAPLAALAYFDIVNLDLGSIGVPLQCVSLHTVRTRLVFLMSLPVATAALLFFAGIVSSLVRAHRRDVKEGRRSTAIPARWT